MSGFVQFLGWAALLLGAVLIIAAFDRNSSMGGLGLAIAIPLLLNGAMLIVFGEMAADIRRMRLINEQRPY